MIDQQFIIAAAAICPASVNHCIIDQKTDPPDLHTQVERQDRLVLGSC
jgi:hypothetical protein